MVYFIFSILQILDLLGPKTEADLKKPVKEKVNNLKVFKQSLILSLGEFCQ